MIRSLGLVEAARIVTLGGLDWAAPFAVSGVCGRVSFSPVQFLWDRVRLRRKSVAWVSLGKESINGLVSARVCSGATAWIVEHLVTPQWDEELCSKLLERVAVYAGRRGAQRLFLYLPDELNILEIGRQSGFTPCIQGVFLTLHGRSALLGVQPLAGFRHRVASDEHSLFRLYNATTPNEIRAGMGMTLQQWKDARKPIRQGTRELVLEHEGEIKGWVRLDKHGKWTEVRAAVHPDGQVDLGGLASVVLAEMGSRPILWQVPEYQSTLRLLLERVGFEVAESYRLMFKSVAVRVEDPALTPAPISG